MYGQNVTIDLTQKAEREYPLTACNRLWLPKTLLPDGKTVFNNNVAKFVLGIRVNDRSAAMLPWSIQDGFVTSVAGPMDRIFVTVLDPAGLTEAYLSTGTDVGVGYGNADGLSPEVSGPADATSTTSQPVAQWGRLHL